MRELLTDAIEKIAPKLGGTFFNSSGEKINWLEV